MNDAPEHKFTDWEIAQKLQKHGELCGPDDCHCDYLERVQNTFFVLRALREKERGDCEKIARECGSDKVADRIRDRRMSDRYR